MNVVASSPEGLEKSLAEEISNLGGFNINTYKRFINFECDFETFYRVHFYSRLAFRFYREIASFNCYDKQSLYAGVRDSFDWLNWLHFDKTFNVQVTGRTSSLSHTHFTALEVKNSITDLQQAVWNKRSNISLANPDFIIHLHLNNNKAILSLQSSVESLHKRGYRPAIGNAPLKENLASGLINMTQWNGKVPLIDFMCGSGTFLIEAVNQYLGVPINIDQVYLFENWLDFRKDIYLNEKNKAKNKIINYEKLPTIIGCEINKKVFEQANVNISLAGLKNYIELINNDFLALQLSCTPGIIICNPPYGKKLGDENELIYLYEHMGIFLKNNFSGWEFWLLSGNPKLTKYLKMKSSLKIPVSNGGIDCRWIKYLIR
ncbi:RNA methyltransferase [Prochlorococcus marinus str. XMU1401]|uniref:Class I SAM-dependent RNA methyltransferase n=1 Tax=Prochlorococcus marinus str. XMU1401 TaxID=2052594 RepID=A0A8I2BJG0_PROMR|nr:THUMP domain-containing protein [Prochlorococcus marinus]MBO8221945.1 class I SAM-dependent RNA methyltransferase [Prochlorococcus marinus str. XMU1401]MBW3060326.1 RNA methyltransferase [Prochlorococcus marinus str. XMU1401E]MCQ9198429.1 THUMP domain-containing protein [Prochlorococcus marinus XMU1429]PJC84465.1 RNA methyltransferase [Prochlorococcus marinus str. XMU1401]